MADNDPNKGVKVYEAPERRRLGIGMTVGILTAALILVFLLIRLF